MAERKLEYRINQWTHLRRRLFRPLFRLAFRILCRIKIYGLENVPPYGPYILAYNHLSLIEPPLILAFWPYPPEAVAASEVWERRGQDMLVRLYGTIPVHRGQFDRRVIQRMLSTLAAGRPLAVAPEGGRTHTPGLRRGLPGVGYLIDKAGVPALPVGIVGGTTDLFERIWRMARPTLSMHIGQLLHFPPLSGERADRRAGHQAYSDRIMENIAALLPPSYRGEYS